MGKELNILNQQIARMRDAAIEQGINRSDNAETKRKKVSPVSNNPNRTLFSPESLREHNVPGYGEEIEEVEELEI